MNTTITRDGFTFSVPSLAIDSQLGIGPTGRIERRIVAALYAHLEKHGFAPTYVHDGDTTTRTPDAKAAMEVIFNLDEASVRFAPMGDEIMPPDAWERGWSDMPNEHGVLLILGNGIDIVADWNYHADDRDGFNAAMCAFDAEAFA